MSTVMQSTIADIVDAVVNEVKPEKVILFGSHARGTATHDSDLDLAIVEREPFGPQRSRRAELSRIRRVLYPFAMPVDILVFSSREVAEWRDSINHILAHCLREGKVLYDRREACTHDA